MICRNVISALALLSASAAFVAPASAATATFEGDGFSFPAGSLHVWTNVFLPDMDERVAAVRVRINDLETPSGKIYLRLVKENPDGTFDRAALSANEHYCLTPSGSITFDSRASLSWNENRVCSAGDFVLQPAGDYSAFLGESGEGRWALVAYRAQSAGSIGSWTLEIDYEVEFAWEAGEWSDWSRTCGDASRSRSVTCAGSDGREYEGALCSGPAPATREESYLTSGCSYSWVTSSWQPVAGCGETTETRYVSCRESSGRTVGLDLCDQAEKPLSEQLAAAPSYATCTYEYTVGAWETTQTCGSSLRTRDLYCQRSDGTLLVNPDFCGNDPLPVLSEMTEDYSACTYSWTQTGFTMSACVDGERTWTPTYRCDRSNGNQVAASFCSDVPFPSSPKTDSCNAFADFDVMPDDDPSNPPIEWDEEEEFVYGDGEPSTGEGSGPWQGNQPEEAQAFTGGSYDPETGTYTTADGEVLTGGYFLYLERTYYWYPQGSSGPPAVVMRRVLN